MSRELRVALLLVLAGGALLLLAGGRPWLDVTLPRPAPLPSVHEVRSGNDVVAGISPLGLLGLAGVAALAATRARGRVVVGALLLLAGAGAVVTVARSLRGGAGAALGEPAPQGFTAWPYVALLAGLLLALGGLMVAVRGRRWAALSARYDAPAARAQARPAQPEVAAWDALDRGEDPTGGPPADRP